MLSLKAEAKLQHLGVGGILLLHRPVTEADGHHPTVQRSTDQTPAAEAAAKAQSDPGDKVALYPQLLPHDLQDRLRSVVVRVVEIVKGSLHCTLNIAHERTSSPLKSSATLAATPEDWTTESGMSWGA